MKHTYIHSLHLFSFPVNSATWKLGLGNPQVQQQPEQREITPVPDRTNTDMVIINWLFRHGHVDINAVDNSGNTALHYTISTESPTRLHEACRVGDTSWINEPWFVLFDINARDDDGRTPLHVAAMNGHMHVVRALLAYGADEYLVDDNNMTAADLANKFGFAHVANEIIPRIFRQLEDYGLVSSV